MQLTVSNPLVPPEIIGRLDRGEDPREIADRIVPSFEGENVRDLARDDLDAAIQHLAFQDYSVLAAVISDWSATADVYRNEDCLEGVRAGMTDVDLGEAETIEWRALKTQLGS